MFLFWLIILVLCLLLLLHSYLLFPAWMMKVRKEPLSNEFPSELPLVAVVVAAYNEEDVIARKIRSALNSDYPEDKIEVWVGSDGSDDSTNTIVDEFVKQDSRVKACYFEERAGKPAVLNKIIRQTDAGILILTDADTFFNPSTIPEVIKPFADPNIGGVQADIHTYVNKREEVGHQEKVYNDREFRIKKGESTYGAVIGAYGACYAVRHALYRPIPSGFYVDDFFIFMNILNAGYQTVFAPNAVCDMEVSGKSEVQFKRKVRISVGNFQNLFYFKSFINPFKGFPGVAFFSHKVIRWFGPFLMVILLAANAALVPYSPAFFWLMLGQIIFYAVGFLDLLLSKWSLNLKLIRYIRHFVLMNLALFVGFFRFLTFEGDGKWE